MKKLFCLWIVVFFATVANAQADSTEKENKTEFKLGTFYISSLNYYGRVDSLQSSGVFPLAELWLNDRFYINAAPVFVNNNRAGFQYEGTVTTAGFQSKSRNEKFFSHFYFIKPFYQKSSSLPQSVLKAQTGTSLAWQNKLLNINAGADLKFSDKMDYGLSGGLDHIIRKQFDGKTVVVLDPSVYVYAGTQQFTKSYYKKTTGFLGLPTGEELVTEQASKLSILSYELSMPVIVASGKLQFILNPAYVIPQNIIDTGSSTASAEQAKEMFYITAGVKIIL